MTFSKAVLFGAVLGTWGLFAYSRNWATGAVFAIALIVFFAAEAFGAYEALAGHYTALLSEAAERNDKNEARIKQLVEAGIRMEAKVTEIDNKVTVDGIGRFMGAKR